MTPMIVLVLALTMDLSATQSQPQRSGQPVPQTNPTQNQPANDQRGTEQAPVVVKVVPTPKTNKETSDEEKQRQDQSYANWWMVKLTGLLSIIGLVTAGVVGWQAWETRRAATASLESAKTASTNLYVSLRARMGLHAIQVRNFAPDQETCLLFSFQNFGGKGALLEDYCILPTVQPLPSKPDYDAAGWRELGAPVEAGARHTIFFRINPPITGEQWTVITNEQGVTRLRIYGALRYSAGFGTRKIVGFCREFDPQMTRLENKGKPVFSTAGGKAYNHAD